MKCYLIALMVIIGCTTTAKNTESPFLEVGQCLQLTKEELAKLPKKLQDEFSLVEMRVEKLTGSEYLVGIYLLPTAELRLLESGDWKEVEGRTEVVECKIEYKN